LFFFSSGGYKQYFKANKIIIGDARGGAGYATAYPKHSRKKILPKPWFNYKIYKL